MFQKSFIEGSRNGVRREGRAYRCDRAARCVPRCRVCASSKVTSLVVMLMLALSPACVRRTGRTLNNNFYVIQNKGRERAVNYNAMLPRNDPQLSNSISQTLKAQANNSPARKDSISNAEILEKDNPEFSDLLARAKERDVSGDVYFRLGKAYHQFRVYEEAQRFYQKAIQLEPENASYHEQFGRLWRDWGAPELGINSVQQALQLKPEAAEAWNTLGTVHDKMGRRKQAQAAYLRALAIDPGLDYVHSNLCFSYLQDADFERAIYHGEQATRLNPSSAVAHNNLGLALGARGSFEAALHQFRMAGDEASARNNLGLILLQKDRITESMEQFKLAARMRPFYRAATENYHEARKEKVQRDRSQKSHSGAPEILGFEWDTHSEEAANLNLPLRDVGSAGMGVLTNHLKPVVWEAGRPALWPRLAAGVGGQAFSFEIVRPEELRREGQIVASLLNDSRHQLSRVSDATSLNLRTVVYYQPGYSRMALELAHRIPGDQLVLRSARREHSPEVKVVLGNDILSQVARLSAP